MNDLLILTLILIVPPLAGLGITRLTKGRKTNEDCERKTEHDRAGVSTGADAAKRENYAEGEIQWKALCLEGHKNGLRWMRVFCADERDVPTTARFCGLRHCWDKRTLQTGVNP